jgi:hypothetical protein
VNVEIGTNGLQLRLPAQARRPHARNLRKVFNLGIKPRAEGIARILSFGDRNDFEPRRKLSGQVFQRMHSEIDAASGEGFFDLFRKNSLAQSTLGANHGEGNIGDLVAGSVDDFDFHFVSTSTQQRGNVVGLPEGELGAARANAEFRHGARPQAGYSTKAKGGYLGRLEKVILYRA